MDILYPLLRTWFDRVSDKNTTPTVHSSDEERDHCSNTEDGKLSYCDLLEICIPKAVFSLSKDVEVRREINESLRKRALSVKDWYKRRFYLKIMQALTLQTRPLSRPLTVPNFWPCSG